jgi:16S rRNA (guanine966-N2)-methyltransferase
VLVDVRTSTARRNIRELGLEDRCEVERSDALRFLRRNNDRYDLVLCDAPYRLADRLAPDLDKLIAPRLAPGGRVVIESGVRAPLELSLPLSVERAYGDTLVRVYDAAPQR